MLKCAEKLALGVSVDDDWVVENGIDGLGRGGSQSASTHSSFQRLSQASDLDLVGSVFRPGRGRGMPRAVSADVLASHVQAELIMGIPSNGNHIEQDNRGFAEVSLSASKHELQTETPVFGPRSGMSRAVYTGTVGSRVDSEFNMGGPSNGNPMEKCGEQTGISLPVVDCGISGNTGVNNDGTSHNGNAHVWCHWCRNLGHHRDACLSKDLPRPDTFRDQQRKLNVKHFFAHEDYDKERTRETRSIEDKKLTGKRQYEDAERKLAREEEDAQLRFERARDDPATKRSREKEDGEISDRRLREDREFHDTHLPRLHCI